MGGRWAGAGVGRACRAIPHPVAAAARPGRPATPGAPRVVSMQAQASTLRASNPTTLRPPRPAPRAPLAPARPRTEPRLHHIVTAGGVHLGLEGGKVQGAALFGGGRHVAAVGRGAGGRPGVPGPRRGAGPRARLPAQAGNPTLGRATEASVTRTSACVRCARCSCEHATRARARKGGRLVRARERGAGGGTGSANHPPPTHSLTPPPPQSAWTGQTRGRRRLPACRPARRAQG